MVASHFHTYTPISPAKFENKLDYLGKSYSSGLNIRNGRPGTGKIAKNMVKNNFYCLLNERSEEFLKVYGVEHCVLRNGS